MICIGIDTGVNTGFAVWDSSRSELVEVKTLRIDEALEKVLQYHHASQELGESIYVCFEDARQRKWYGANARAKMQGAGAVKRDSKIWEEFLKAHKIKFWAKPPTKGMTKLSVERFEALTGWKGRTSEHARDAALMVFGL